MKIHAAATPCPSCGTENPVLELRCSACGSFVRDRVPTVDLFSALWGMIETPAATLLRFARSEQKNYVHVIFALMGPLFMALALAAVGAGDLGVSFATLLFVIGIAGPVLGLLLFPVVALLSVRMLRWFFGLDLRYRLVAGYIAYASTPLMWSSVVLLPLQLAIFGITLFSTNPAGWSMQPLPFWLLAGLEIVAVIWTALLLPLSLRVHGLSHSRAMVFSGIVMLSVFLLTGVFSYLVIPLLT